MTHPLIETIKKRMGAPIFIFFVIILLLILFIGFGRAFSLPKWKGNQGTWLKDKLPGGKEMSKIIF